MSGNRRRLTPKPPGPAVAYGTRSSHSSRRSDAKADRSIRVTLTGCRTLEEAHAMLDDAWNKLSELNIPKAAGINLYLTPKDAEGQPLRHSFSDIVIDKVPAYRCAADQYKAP